MALEWLNLNNILTINLCGCEEATGIIDRDWDRNSHIILTWTWILYLAVRVRPCQDIVVVLVDWRLGVHTPYLILLFFRGCGKCCIWQIENGLDWMDDRSINLTGEWNHNTSVHIFIWMTWYARDSGLLDGGQLNIFPRYFVSFIHNFMNLFLSSVIKST